MIPVIITADLETLKTIINSIHPVKPQYPEVEGYRWDEHTYSNLLNVINQIQKQLEPVCPLVKAEQK